MADGKQTDNSVLYHSIANKTVGYSVVNAPSNRL